MSTQVKLLFTHFIALVNSIIVDFYYYYTTVTIFNDAIKSLDMVISCHDK